MPKKPRERYFQLRGQPHKGLDDPLKYGLTHEQVVALIDSGKWDAFRKKWIRQQKREEYLASIDYRCPKCGEQFLELGDWTGNQCTTCFKKQQGEHAKKGVMYSKNVKCISCAAATDKENTLCQKCAKLLSQMRSLENDPRA
jgi:formylmethanofuran dehydrogenase subunit E